MLQRVLGRVKRFLSPENRRSQLLRMVLVALALRLVVMAFVYTDQLDPALDHHRFGYEAGRVARSLVQGQGFANALHGITGPTAIVVPIYPLIVAGFFKIFGIYSTASALAILSFNALTSALTCLPVFFIARKAFGDRVGAWAGWAWAFFPYAVYFPVEEVWTTWLATLMVALLFLISLHLQDSIRPAAWIGFGLLWGMTALIEAMPLILLPPLAGWACYRLRQRAQSWLGPAALAALAFLVVVSPWFIRNYRTFHRVVPFRDNFALELYSGNIGDGTNWREFHPGRNGDELQEYQRLGELGYIARKGQQVRAEITSRPGKFAWLTFRRMGYIWTGFWSMDRDYLKDEPLEPLNVFFCTCFTALGVLGLRRIWRACGSALAMPYALVLLIYPVLYYITHWQIYYRRPIDAIFVVLAVYALMPARYLATNPGLQEPQPLAESLVTAGTVCLNYRPAGR